MIVQIVSLPSFAGLFHHSMEASSEELSRVVALSVSRTILSSGSSLFVRGPMKRPVTAFLKLSKVMAGLHLIINLNSEPSSTGWSFLSFKQKGRCSC